MSERTLKYERIPAEVAERGVERAIRTETRWWPVLMKSVLTIGLTAIVSFYAMMAATRGDISLVIFVVGSTLAVCLPLAVLMFGIAELGSAAQKYRERTGIVYYTPRGIWLRKVSGE